MIGKTISRHSGVVWLLVSACAAAVSAADWPQWRGPNADGISTETGLLKEWPEGGPPVVWEIDTLGEGYSCITVHAGRIYTQGNVDGIEKIIALNEADGSPIWVVQPEPVKAAIEARVAETLAGGDRNGDGKFEEAEAVPLLGWEVNNADMPAGGDAEATAGERAARLMAALDSDGDGALDKNEGARTFGQYFRDIDQEDPNADVAALANARVTPLMAALDGDGNGELAGEELQGTWLQQSIWQIDSRPQGARRGDGKLTSAEILQYLQTAEPGRDGRITASELQIYYAKTFPNCDGIYTADELRALLSLGYRNNQGNGPRGQPTIDEGRLYVEGAKGDVSCLDAETGQTMWHVNLIDDFGGTIPNWGYSESVLISGDMAIVTPGGEAGAVVALDKKTGELIWRSDEVNDVAEYSSVVAAEVGGIPQFVQFARKAVYGLTRDTGRLLWTYRHQKADNSINITTPVVAEDRVLIASAYGNGAGLAAVTTADGKQSAEEVYFEKQLDNHHGGIIKIGDHVYGTGSRGLICMNYATGEIVWQDRSVGKGSLTVADGMIYMLGERHQMALVEATPDGYREHGRFDIEKLGRPSWTHPVIANGRLYIRNQHKLTAYDVRGQ